MGRYNTKGYNDDPEEEDDDDYSPTSWDRFSDETDEDYEDRMQDQNDMYDSLN